MLPTDQKIFESLEPVLESVFAVLVGIIVAVVLIGASGYDISSSFWSLFGYPFLTESGFLQTLTYATPLILTAITFAVGIRVGVFNIGAQGMLLMGAGGVLLANIFHLPMGLHLLVAVLFAAGAGAALSAVPAILKLKRGVHEVITTIMLNWVAFYFLKFLVTWPFSHPTQGGKSFIIQPASRFSILFSGHNLTSAIFLSLALAVLVYFFLWYTKTGKHLRAAGLNRDVARNSGLNVDKLVLLAFLIGGISSGIAGAALSAGNAHIWSVYKDLSSLLGFGFAGIAVSAIGRNHPLGILPSAVFFGGLMTGILHAQLMVGLPSELIHIIIGIVILVVALPEILRMMRDWRR